MRMSAPLKWGLVTVLLLAAAIFAYTRISGAIDDYEMEQERQFLQTPGPDMHAPTAYPQDRLDRT